MRVPLALALVLTMATFLPAQGWKKLEGDWVPELKVRSWLNTDDKAPTTTSMKGKVWLLMFFQCNEECLGKIAELSKLHDKHFKAGFRVLAISNDILRIFEG